MLCNICGHECADDASFCPKCGKSFAPKTQEPIAGSEEIAETPINTDYVNNAEVVETQPKQQSKLVLILGIVALAVNATLGCLCGCLGSLPGIACAIVGIVMGMKEKQNYAPGEKNKNTETGLILCYVALGIFVVSIIVNFILGGVLGSMSQLNW